MPKSEKIKPKIGFIGESRENILNDLIFAVKNRFDYYEISPGGENFDFNAEIIKKANEIIKNNNISLNLHIPYFLPINSLIPDVSEASLKFVKKEIILASKLGAKKITIHSGDKDLPNTKAAVTKNIKMLIKNLKEIVSFGKKYKIKIGLENSWTPERLCKSSKDLLHMTDSVKGLRVVFDAGHANAIKANLVKYFKEVKNQVINIHISDNNGKTDQHAMLGEGNINYKNLLGEIKNSGYHGPFILEVFSHKNVLKGREIFLNLWNQI